jgi:nitrite reductase (NADH) small subunit
VKRWVAVCEADALQEGKVLRAEVEGIGLCLLRDGPHLHALEDRCPHRGARLSDGVVYEGCMIACGDHGWTVDARDGRVQAPQTGCVQTFAAAIRGDQVCVELPPGLYSGS